MGADVRLYDPESISYYTVHHAQIPHYRMDRVLLAGDATHVHSPAGGQGMNTGMQDAANLAGKLALVCRGLADPQILDSYHAERHPVGADVVRRTTLMADGMTLSGPPAHAPDTLMRLIDHIEPLRQAMAENITEISVGNRGGPIAAQAGRRPHGAPAPGTRAADLPGLTTAQGDPVRIGDFLRDRPAQLLLTLSDDPGLLDQLSDALGPLGIVVPVVTEPAAAPAHAIVDAAGASANQYGVGSGGLALIRPDGYFGYLPTSVDPAALQAHLHSGPHVRRPEVSAGPART